MGYKVVGIRTLDFEDHLGEFVEREEAEQFIKNCKEGMPPYIGNVKYDNFKIIPEIYELVKKCTDIPIKHFDHLRCGDSIYGQFDMGFNKQKYFETKKEAMNYIKKHEKELYPNIIEECSHYELQEYWLRNDIDGDKLLFYWCFDVVNNNPFTMDVKESELWDEIDGEDKQ